MQNVSRVRHKAGTKQRAKIQLTGLNLRLIHLERLCQPQRWPAELSEYGGIRRCWQGEASRVTQPQVHPSRPPPHKKVELRLKGVRWGFYPQIKLQELGRGTTASWPLGGDLSPARGRVRLPSAGAGCLAPSLGQVLRLRVSNLGGEVSGVFGSRNTSKCALRHNRASCWKRWEMSPAVFL